MEIDSSNGAECSESKAAAETGSVRRGSDSTVISKSICKDERERYEIVSDGYFADRSVIR